MWLLAEESDALAFFIDKSALRVGTRAKVTLENVFPHKIILGVFRKRESHRRLTVAHSTSFDRCA